MNIPLNPKDAAVDQETSSSETTVNYRSNYDQSDDFVARLVGQRWSDQNARFFTDLEVWHLWTGDHWKPASRQHVISELRGHLRSIESDLRTGTLLRNGRIKSVEELCRSNRASLAHSSDYDCDPDILGVSGGHVELKTGRLITPGDPSLKITRIAPVRPQQSREAPPTKFLKFLDRIFKGDQEVMQFIQRLCGYCLTGRTDEQKFFFMYGAGRNGKSVLIEVMMKIMGSLAVKSSTEVFLKSRGQKHPTGLAGILDARLVMATEIPSGARWDESLLKDFTGGEQVAARKMRQDFSSKQPVGKVILSGNNQPSFDSLDVGMRARLVLIPFEVTIPPEEQVPNLAATLVSEEGPSILRWMLDGASEWYQGGLKIPSAIHGASSDYFEQEDTLGQWLDTMRPSGPCWRSNQELISSLNGFMTGVGQQNWDTQRLSRELSKRGYQPIKRSGKRGFEV